MKKVRMGLIGCGGMMATHAKSINMVEEVEIVAVCDIIRERAEKVAAGLHQPFVTTDYTEMVDLVDAVLVVLPHDLHYECGMFFAEHKKHVMMEKPLCNTEEECLNLIETCEKNNVTLMCAYPVRYWQGVRKLKEMVDSGNYGKIFQMSVWTEQFTKIEKDEKGRLHWSACGKIGGGQFFSHGCHYVDILLWFLGRPLRGMHFGTKVGTEWMLREGTSSAIMEFENGAVGYHGATWGARGTKLGYNFQIQTEKGLLEYDHAAGEVRVYDKNARHNPGEMKQNEYYVVWERGSDTSKETQHEIRHFADCVLNGKKPNTNGRDSLQGLRAIWRMYDAEKTGIVADLSDLAFGE